MILTPLLLLLTPLSALTVIGTDLLSGAVTKLAGVLEHRKLGHVEWKLAGWLLGGSLPGTLSIRWLEIFMSPQVLDHTLRAFLGVTLGSRVTRLIPERTFAWLFSILYFSFGARLLAG